MSSAAETIESRTPLQTWLVGPWSVYDHASAQLYAQALGEHDTDLLAGTRLCETFAILPVWRTQEQVLEQAFGPEAMVNAVHGEQRFEFIRPMEVDTEVRGQSKIVGVHQRKKGTLLSVYSEVLDKRGLLSRQQYILFALGVWLDPPCDAASGEEVLAPVIDEGALSPCEGVWEATSSQVSRYATASGDHFALHTDETYAKSLGYPSIIMHGMCTLGIATRSIRDCVRESGDVRIKSLGVRFSAPVVPPTKLKTTVNLERASSSEATGQFTTLDHEQNVTVLSNGYFAAERL